MRRFNLRTLIKVILILLALFLIFSLTPLEDHIVPYKIRVLYHTKEFERCESYPYQAVNFDKSERRLCYSQALIFLVKRVGPRLTMDAFEAYRKTREGEKISESRCHSLGHDLGNASVYAGYSGKEILEGCRDFCVGGCINGAAHVYVLENKSIEELEAFCNPEGVDSNVRTTCYHGIGHSLVEYTNIDVKKTLQICKEIKFPEGKYQCGHAAVMDYGIPLNAPVSNLPSDLSSFCASQDTAFRGSCFIYVGFLEWARTLDAQSAFKECREVPEEFQVNCRERLGEVLFSKYEFTDISKAVKECLKGSLGEAGDCVRGVALISLHSTSGSFGDFGEKICGATDEPLKSQCYAYSAEEVELKLGEDARIEFCQKIDDSFKDKCLEFKL